MKAQVLVSEFISVTHETDGQINLNIYGSEYLLSQELAIKIAHDILGNLLYHRGYPAYLKEIEAFEMRGVLNASPEREEASSYDIDDRNTWEK
jgi:hypothetical protein